MRVFAQTPSEVAAAHAIQDTVRITPLVGRAHSGDYPPPDADSAGGFFKILDYVLRVDGHPDQEDALAYRFRAIGIGAAEAFDIGRLDPETRAGVEAGFAEAIKIIRASRSQLGTSTGTGWNMVDKATYGFNYLNRAVINFVGLGANVQAENFSFNTFVDGQGCRLDGSKGGYVLELKPPPPVEAFWSVTLYDTATMELYPNALGRYLISDRTPGLKVKADGAVTIAIQHLRPRGEANWLPAPDGPFYLAIRSYLPKPELLNGGWRPEPVRSVRMKEAC
jgi:hypothetical protein